MKSNSKRSIFDLDRRLETSFYHDEWDGSGTAGRLGVPTISGSELLHNDTKKMVEREFAPDDPNESLAGLLDYYFSVRTQNRIRARLPPSESLAGYPFKYPKAAYDSIRVNSAAIELAVTERDIEMRPGPGRKRQGREVKKGCPVRLEPRHRTALKGFGLDLQTVADGLAASWTAATIKKTRMPNYSSSSRGRCFSRTLGIGRSRRAWNQRTSNDGQSLALLC
jgi:hypothetical protein